MPGMNSGVNISDPTVVAAFKTALLHQGLAALLIFALIGLVWLSLRAFLPATAGPSAPGSLTADRPGGRCCASASACCGYSTASCRRSRRWRLACRRR